jgi:hypothetical protein
MLRQKRGRAGNGDVWPCVLSRMRARVLCNLAKPPVRTHSFRTRMTHFPQPHQKQRAVRVEFHVRVPAAIRLEDGRRHSGRLRKISLTGGLLRMSESLVTGTLVEVIFLSLGGPVLGLAELLTPVSATLKCLQPFKFIMIEDNDYRRLNSLIVGFSGPRVNE